MTNPVGKPKDLLGKQNACPVCGKPRSSGIKFIDHGKCMEELARRAKARNPNAEKWSDKFSEEEVRKSRARHAAKNGHKHLFDYLRIRGERAWDDL